MTLRSASIPFAWRTFILVAALIACLTLNADYARGQTPPDDPPPPDDHGDTVRTATVIEFGSSVDGRIDPADDVDIFIFDLSEQPGPTDAWIHSTGELDSIGLLFDSNLDNISWGNNTLYYGQGARVGFNMRVTLDPDVYVVVVQSRRNLTVGDYILHVVEAPTDPSEFIDSPTQLDIDSPIPGAIRLRGRSQYFKLDVTEPSSLVIQAENAVFEWREELYPLAPLVAKVLDEQGEEVPVNINGLAIRTPKVERFGFIIEDDFEPGTYLVELTTPSDRLATEYPVFYTIQMVEDVYYKSFRDYCKAQTEALEDTSIDDPFYACQWHLDQPNGEDVNVKPVWDQGLMGEGINVAVVDDGMDWTHEDLIDNVNPDLNHDYTGEGDINQTYEHHGTAVSGIIAARDNDVGVRGVAPRAAIYGYNMIPGANESETESAEDAIIADAAARHAGVTAVSNNSWGPVASPALPPAIWELAIENGVTRGYDGKGVFYVFAGGNGHDEGDDSNLDGYANFYAVSAVCAVNEAGTRSWYSEMGANLWLCGPSSHPRTEERYRGTVTTENSNRYRDDFGGTSSAAPAVSGVAALVRQANPDLTWRDLKLILAETARKNDPANPGWEDGARMYGLSTDSYHFNHEYGFGVVDAAAAVELARSWTNLPPIQQASVQSPRIDRLIPEAYDAASIQTVTLTLELALDTGIEFTEFVEIDTAFQHNSFRDLDIELESPSGAVSKLVPPFDTFTDDDDPDNDYVPLRDPYRFGSAKHLGENPNGVWTLRITDRFREGAGSIESWGITVYGHTPDNIVPTFPDGETTTRSVAENTPAGAPIGDPVAAVDNEPLSYTIGGPDAAHFSIEADTGQIAVGARAILDYETRAGYEVTVTASDQAGASSTTAVSISVTDVSLGEFADSYDTDRNERIDISEAIQAVRHYFDGLITLDEAVQVLSLYFSG